MSDNLVIGACDWRHKHWSKSFYPQELPSDWCLGFYSNEFEAVLVPSSRWHDKSGYRCQGWLDEVNENFRFYVEIPPALSEGDSGRERFIEDMSLLEDALGGVVLTTRCASHAPGTDVSGTDVPDSDFRGSDIPDSDIRGPDVTAPCDWFSDAMPHIPLLSPAAAAQGYQCYSNDDRDIVMVRLYHDLVDKRDARMLLEQALREGCGNAQICIIDSDELRASDLSQMRQVIEIMGL